MTAMASNRPPMMRLMSHRERTLKCDLTLFTKYVIVNHHNSAPAKIQI